MKIKKKKGKKEKKKKRKMKKNKREKIERKREREKGGGIRVFLSSSTLEYSPFCLGYDYSSRFNSISNFQREKYREEVSWSLILPGRVVWGYGFGNDLSKIDYAGFESWVL